MTSTDIELFANSYYKYYTQTDNTSITFIVLSPDADTMYFWSKSTTFTAARWPTRTLLKLISVGDCMSHTAIDRSCAKKIICTGFVRSILKQITQFFSAIIIILLRSFNKPSRRSLATCASNCSISTKLEVCNYIVCRITIRCCWHNGTGLFVHIWNNYISATPPTFEQVTMIPSANLKCSTASQWCINVLSISPVRTLHTLDKMNNSIAYDACHNEGIGWQLIQSNVFKKIKKITSGMSVW